MKILTAVSFLFLLFSSFHALGQCCSAGNPSGGDGIHEGLDKNELSVFVSYKHSLSKDYFHNDSETEVPYIEKSYFDYSSLSLTYGLFSRISLHSELGYFIDKTQDLKMSNENNVIKSHGLGDLSFNVRYTAVRTVKPVSQLVFSGGLKVPVGAFNEKTGGVSVPISLQPSSGAVKFNAGVFYSRKRSDRKFGWKAFTLFETSNTINKGFIVYKYGDFLLLSLTGTYNLLKKLDFAGGLKLEWRGKDTRENGILIESSGSRVILLNPQLMYNFNNKWALIVVADIPIYKYVNGYQLTNKFSILVGVKKYFLSKSTH